MASSFRRTLLFLAFVACGFSAPPAESGSGFRASRTAADSCKAKLNRLEDYQAHGSKSGKKTTFTDDEVNSYLALDLSRKYHPSLKSLIMSFEDNDRLQGVADIDFDRLGASSSQLLPTLLSWMFSGTHTLSVRGQLISKDGEARFQLEKAAFDGKSLPISLVEKIVTAVGRKQKPPFDPLQPSKLPYGIDHIDVHTGRLVTYQ